MFVRDRYCQRRTCWSDDVACERAGESKRMKNARHRGNPEWRGASVHGILFHRDTLALILPCDAIQSRSFLKLMKSVAPAIGGTVTVAGPAITI
jgi:hypothetical protein